MHLYINMDSFFEKNEMSFLKHTFERKYIYDYYNGFDV